MNCGSGIASSQGVEEGSLGVLLNKICYNNMTIYELQVYSLLMLQDVEDASLR